jgi:SAM-dependent methyltransferase
MKPEQIYEEVKNRYGRIAAEATPAASASCCDTDTDPSCCETITLYDSDTDWLPAGVTNLSLGCGDPLTLAELQPGQTVLDLGSGGGIDCFMAARQVGPTGQVIGVDMTPAMIAKANENKAQVKLENVQFRLGQIENLPVDSATVDRIISNCVINLSPAKAAVFREAFRVLKPGGRLAVSDIVTLGQFSAAERADLEAWAACISGAEDVADYVAAMQAAGFVNISVRDKANPDLELAGSMPKKGPAKWFSARVTAEKPLS